VKLSLAARLEREIIARTIGRTEYAGETIDPSGEQQSTFLGALRRNH